MPSRVVELSVSQMLDSWTQCKRRCRESRLECVAGVEHPRTDDERWEEEVESGMFVEVVVGEESSQRIAT